uniref:tRNA splicing endonuclease n=1 Tax=uncultured marine group II/III euryarchaeote KM3_18_D06 TaxID=1457956 RepID=A0A075GUK9_9EURY|nr:tRNA splicing endonuclease [uncultured marine group II/III euryarchaeote KM3_18_D06]
MAESSGIGPCSPHAEGWVLDGPAAQRLHDKSALGRPHTNNRLLLADSEVLFCSRHRHLKLTEGWLEERAKERDGLLHETAALESMRVPGEKVVLAQNIHHLVKEQIVSEGSWAFRWSRNDKVRKNDPTSEVIWVRDDEPIVWLDLHRWASEVGALGRIAEVLIVDDEMGVTTYRVQVCDPKGTMKGFDESELSQYLDSLIEDSSSGALLPGESEMAKQIGAPIPEGTWIDRDEIRLLSGTKDEVATSNLLRDVLMRGLLPRPGFKYGTRWRLYDGPIGEDHAPWLLQPEWLAPSDWAQACLSARLATGVNKTWLCGFNHNETWHYLGLVRPPADGRWSGFRH